MHDHSCKTDGHCIHRQPLRVFTLPAAPPNRTDLPTPRPRRQVMSSDQEREHALQALRSKLIESREWEAKLKALRLDIKGLQRDYDQTEENIKALQSVGQIIGEVLKQLDEERCTILSITQGRLPVGANSLGHCQRFYSLTSSSHCSHRQGLLRPSLCRRLPVQG